MVDNSEKPRGVDESDMSQKLVSAADLEKILAEAAANPRPKVDRPLKEKENFFIPQAGTEQLPAIVPGSERRLDVVHDKPDIKLEFVKLEDGSWAVSKTFIPEAYQGEEERAAFADEAIREIQVTYEMSQVPAAAFVEVVGYSLVPPEFKLYMRYYVGNTLEFQSTQNGVPDRDQLRSLVDRIGNAMVEMHHRSGYHNDIKSKNVLFEEDNNYNSAVLADLGTSTRVTTRFLGTPEYMDDYSLRTGVPSQYRDVFAFCVMLYVNMNGRDFPFGKPQSHLGNLMDNVGNPDWTKERWSAELGISTEQLEVENWREEVVIIIRAQYLATERHYVPLDPSRVDPSLHECLDELNEYFREVFERSRRDQGDTVSLREVDRLLQILRRSESAEEQVDELGKEETDKPKIPRIQRWGQTAQRFIGGWRQVLKGNQDDKE